jgi:hypothetical protein
MAEPQYQCWQQDTCCMDPACPVYPTCAVVEGKTVSKVLGPSPTPPEPAPAAPDLIGVRGWYLGMGRYFVAIVDGPATPGLDGGGWVVWGRKRAIRRATRELIAYRDRASRRQASPTITTTQSEPRDVTDGD